MAGPMPLRSVDPLPILPRAGKPLSLAVHLRHAVCPGDELAATCCGGGSCAPFVRASGATPGGIRSIRWETRVSKTEKARSVRLRADCNAQGSRNNNTTEPTMIY
jgi:hypothetical protein